MQAMQIMHMEWALKIVNSSSFFAVDVHAAYVYIDIEAGQDRIRSYIDHAYGDISYKLSVRLEMIQRILVETYSIYHMDQDRGAYNIRHGQAQAQAHWVPARSGS